MRPLYAALCAMLALPACAQLNPTRPSNYQATCRVLDVSPASVPGQPLVGFQRQIYATGADFNDLRQHLEQQNAGTYSRPCLDLVIQELPTRRSITYGPMVASARPYTGPLATVRVHFPFDSTSINAEGRAALAEAAASIMQVGAARIEIDGHTDTSGTERYNDRLSQRRANAVQSALTNLGLPAGIMTTRGAGEHELLIPTGDGVRNAMNRRAEIVIR